MSKPADLRHLAVPETRIEVLHHWVSESEVAALNTIRDALAAKGYGWQDSAVGGMSGGNMQQALRSRLAAGNPPGAMQFIGWEGIDWSAEGVMRDLNALSEANGWEATIAPQVLPIGIDITTAAETPVEPTHWTART